MPTSSTDLSVMMPLIEREDVQLNLSPQAMWMTVDK